MSSGPFERMTPAQIQPARPTNGSTMTPSMINAVKRLVCFVTDSALRWRRCLTAACLSYILVNSASAQQNTPAVQPNRQNDLECVEELNIPVYAGALWRAQVTGDVMVSIQILADRRAKAVAKSTHISLSKYVEQEIIKSKFRPACMGRTIEIFLRYRQEGLIDEGPVNRLKFRPPNRFEVIACPPPPHTIIN